jgi:hypothetical protein
LHRFTSSRGFGNWWEEGGQGVGAGKNLGEIARLIWEIPSGVREISVPVEFGNISTK